MGTLKGKGTGKKLLKAGKKLLTGKGTGKKKRSRGPTYWQNKVLVAKLKKKYNRLKYGGR